VKSQQSLKLRIFDYVFLRFFEMPLQKYVKSRVFLDFQKNVKKRILELCIQAEMAMVGVQDVREALRFFYSLLLKHLGGVVELLRTPHSNGRRRCCWC